MIRYLCEPVEIARWRQWLGGLAVIASSLHGLAALLTLMFGSPTP